VRFNQIRKAFKEAAPKKQDSDTAAKPKQIRKQKSQSQNNSREMVVSGVVKWIPVDRVAARVVSPASWIHKAPATTKETAEQEKRTAPMKTKIPSAETPTGEPLYSTADIEVVAIDIAKERLATLKGLAEQAEQCSATMRAQVREIGGACHEVAALTTKAIQEVRSARMALVAETTVLLASLKDVRSFFFDDRHADEVKRLSDFVQIVERLRQQKENGTLDAIADTILALHK